ncbi:MAG TPA: hypothetical protein VKA18_09555 [Alphaproteobacteria bacterium]|nr:hypothetical protein [Alphaproteobacteria bacterium]
MTAARGDLADIRSPDEQARISDAGRLRAYSEDWVSMPRRSESGALLGPETRQQVIALLAKGIDEPAIQAAAQRALAAEEGRIAARHRKQGWVAFLGCVVLAGFSAVVWEGRGQANHLASAAMLGGVGLMLANAIRGRGIRRRSRLLRRREARKKVWRQAIAELAGRLSADR